MHLPVTYDRVERYCPGWKMVHKIILSLAVLRGVALVDKTYIDHTFDLLPEEVQRNKHFRAYHAQSDILMEKLTNAQLTIRVAKKEVTGGSQPFVRIMFEIKANPEDKHPVFLLLNPKDGTF